MNGRKAKIFFRWVIVSLLGFLFVIGLVVTSSFLTIFTIIRKGDETTKSNAYQLTRYYLFSNKTTTELVRLNRKFSRNEYLSLKDESGNLIVITNFVESEFSCSGSCFCRDNRRHAVVLGKSLSIAVAAFSSFFALKIAKEYLNEICVAKFSEKELCSRDKIQAIIDECVEDAEKDGIFLRNFYCEGKCGVNPSSVNKGDEYIEKRMGENDCSKYELQHAVPTFGEDSRIETAENSFRSLYLVPYCASVSEVKHPIFSQKFFLCSGEEGKIECYPYHS